MNKNSNKFIASMVISAMLLSSNIGNIIPHKAYANSMSRIGGLNRYETSKNIALAGFQGGSEYVIITTGTDFADALCAAPLSAVYNAPILVTNKDSLSKETREAMQALGAKKVIILGGIGAVSKNVENQ
ncbi:MAG: cell wall-binding repeat-containing protein, partial [Caloramator sp.]|nr:cell wall-binding repeat-containing protein [Caloramator sp.]